MKENDEGGDQGDGGGLYRIEWMRGWGVLVTKWLTNRLLDIGSFQITFATEKIVQSGLERFPEKQR